MNIFQPLSKFSFNPEICWKCGGGWGRGGGEGEWPYIEAVTRYQSNGSKEDVLATFVTLLSVKLEDKTNFKDSLKRMLTKYQAKQEMTVPIKPSLAWLFQQLHFVQWRKRFLPKFLFLLINWLPTLTEEVLKTSGTFSKIPKEMVNVKGTSILSWV